MMTGVQSLAARSALAVTLAGVSLWATSVRRLFTLADAAFDRLALGLFWTSRLGLYLLLFVALRVTPRGDVTGYFLEAGFRLRGLLPYRDFPSSYAPLHSFLDAGPVHLWHSPAAIILLALLAECCLLPVWISLGRRFFTEPRLRTAVILYVTSPVSLQFATVDGQDNVILALLFVLALLALYHRRDTVSGFLLGLGTVAFKFLPVLYAPLLFTAARRRLRWLLGVIAINALVYGYFLHLHADILFPFRYEGSLRSASNLWYLLESALGIAGLPFALEARLLDVVLLAAVAWGVCSILRARPELRPRVATFATLTVLLALMLFSKKSWPAYLMLTLFPLCLLFGGGRRPRLRIALFALFSAAALVTHSIWSTFLHQQLYLRTHADLVAHRPAAFALMGTQLLLIAGYAWLLTEALRATRDAATPAPRF